MRVLELRGPNEAEAGEKSINPCGATLNPFYFGFYRKQSISYWLLYPPAPSDTLEIRFDSRTDVSKLVSI